MIMMKRLLRRCLDVYMHPLVHLLLIRCLRIPNHSLDGCVSKVLWLALLVMQSTGTRM